MLHRLCFSYCIAMSCVLFLNHSAVAETLVVNPGKWQITTTTSTPSSPQPKIESKTQCVDEAEVDPFEAFAKEDGCDLSNLKKTGRKLTATLSCKGGEGVTPMSGNLEYSVTDTTMNSRMRFEMKDFTQTMISRGKRIGDCDPAKKAEAEKTD